MNRVFKKMVQVQTFSSDDKIYSVDMMFAYINIFKPKYVKIEVNDYLHTLDYKLWGNPKKNIFYSPNDVLQNPKKYKDDYERIKKANLKYPIILANNYIVDGVHRLTKAHLQKKKYIKAYIFEGDLLKKFLINNQRNWKYVDTLKVYDFIQLFHKKFCES